MDIQNIRRALNKSMDFQFDCPYSWLDMIDDTDDLTDEEREWAKEHSIYAVKIDGDEQQRDDLLAALWGVLGDAENEIPLYLLSENGRKAKEAIENAGGTI